MPFSLAQFTVEAVYYEVIDSGTFFFFLFGLGFFLLVWLIVEVGFHVAQAGLKLANNQGGHRTLNF